MNNKRLYSIMVIALAFGVLGVFAQTALAAPLSGAIFTTTVDGSIVNENVRYEAKEDVYLDGGPGPNAPAKAAGLPEGDYYFQVTDPSGKDLLSQDHISCRKIHVNVYGVIDTVYGGTNYVYNNSTKAWDPVAFQHNQGVDVDHSELGAITVQLFPYDDTPNQGGVYKVWITPVWAYAGDPAYNPNGPPPLSKKAWPNGENYQPGDYHGFIPRYSKTDNYKVKQKGKPCDPPVITVRKFHDANMNGVQDVDEDDITGWAVYVKDPLEVDSTEYTTATIVAEPSGKWIFTEDTPTGTEQTVSILDGTKYSEYPVANPTVPVVVAGECGETHEVVYGNVGLGSITACKVFDRNKNGKVDEGEPGIVGWRIELLGVDVLGNAVDLVQETGVDGCTIFENLLPGTYAVEELIPTTGGWVSSGLTSYGPISIESSLSGSTLSGTDAEVTFTNYCEGTADFDTKGYWHNKNGLTELTQGDIDYVNTLAPYATPSDYFDDGDEPFDGVFTNGDLVQPAIGDGEWNGIEVSPAGSAKAEVSQFLVDQNAGSSAHYHQEQLAQQLLAFIFNVLHRLDGPCATLDGTTVSAEDLINQAIAIWESGTDAERTAMSTLLDGFNNSDAVSYVPCEPCPVVYP